MVSVNNYELINTDQYRICSESCETTYVIQLNCYEKRINATPEIYFIIFDSNNRIDTIQEFFDCLKNYGFMTKIINFYFLNSDCGQILYGTGGKYYENTDRLIYEGVAVGNQTVNKYNAIDILSHNATYFSTYHGGTIKKIFFYEKPI